MALDVVVRMSAQEAGAYRAWLEQQRAVDATSGKMKGLGAATGGAKGQLESYFAMQAGRWVSVAGGIGLAVSALRGLADAAREVRQEEAETTFGLDTVFRKFQIQAQLTEAQAPAAQKQIFEIAKTTATPVETVSEIARQLVSSGFETKEVLEGGAAQEFIEAMRASAESGQDVDVRQLTESVTQFILAQRSDKDKQLTRENLRTVVQATQGLFLRRNIQFENLSDLALAAPALSRAGMDPVTQLATFTKLRDVMSSEESGTAIRNIVTRMQTAAASPEKVKALEMLGLKPEDVDAVGETVETAFLRLLGGLKSIPLNEQSIALKKLFEERGGLGADILIQNVADIDKYRREALDQKVFEQSVKTATQGKAAAKTRLQIEKQQQRIGGQGARDELIAEAFDTLPGRSGAMNRIANWTYRFGRFVGMSEDWAASMAANEPGDAQRVQQRLKYLESPNVGRQIPLEGNLTPERRKTIEQAIPAMKKVAPTEASQRAAKATYEIVQHPRKGQVAEFESAGKREAAIVSRAVASGVVPEPTRAELKQVLDLERQRIREYIEHETQRTGKAPTLKEEELWRAMLAALLEVVANTKEPEVRVKNPGEPKRYERRQTAAQPPSGRRGPKGFQGMGVGG